MTKFSATAVAMATAFFIGAAVLPAGPAASADTHPSGTQNTPPRNVGTTGNAPHAETGAGTGKPSVQQPGMKGQPSDRSTGSSMGSDTSGKKPGGTGPGLTEESNQGAREQRLGEKPAP